MLMLQHTPCGAPVLIQDMLEQLDPLVRNGHVQSVVKAQACREAAGGIWRSKRLLGGAAGHGMCSKARVWGGPQVVCWHGGSTAVVVGFRV